MSTDEAKTLTAALAAPFRSEEVHFKPGVVSGNRALALPYVDARAIQDRLDEVLGVDGWQDDYECLPDGSVVCRLRLRLGGEWVTKVDVGGPSDQPDGGDRLKAAFSDALKRAAVKFGVGRYLYRLPSQWVDWDASKKRFAKTPTLPAPATNGNGISEAQWVKLQDMLRTQNIPARDLLAHFNAKRPRDIPAARFDEAMALITDGKLAQPGSNGHTPEKGAETAQKPRKRANQG
jgi:hypothetical protein